MVEDSSFSSSSSSSDSDEQQSSSFAEEEGQSDPYLSSSSASSSGSSSSEEVCETVTFDVEFYLPISPEDEEDESELSQASAQTNIEVETLETSASASSSESDWSCETIQLNPQTGKEEVSYSTSSQGPPSFDPTGLDPAQCDYISLNDVTLEEAPGVTGGGEGAQYAVNRAASPRVKVKATLTRTVCTSTCIIGEFEIAGFKCVTLELPNNGNQNNISCIPSATYQCVPTKSPKFGPTWEVCGVPKRSKILFHGGNKPSDTLGCIILNDLVTPGWGGVGRRPGKEHIMIRLRQHLAAKGIESFDLQIIDKTKQ